MKNNEETTVLPDILAKILVSWKILNWNLRNLTCKESI